MTNHLTDDLVTKLRRDIASMSNGLTQKAISRIEALIANANQVMRERAPGNEGDEADYPIPVQFRLKEDAFYGWRAQSVTALTAIVGADHTYTREFLRLVTDPSTGCVKLGISLLATVTKDLADGFLVQMETLISAEIFSDFLDMAQHQLEHGYKDPSASLAGAVLEDGLRRISRHNGITVSKTDDLGSLSGKCLDAKLYNQIVRKQLAVWTDLRNQADHGHFTEYNADQVKSMIEGVQSFLAAHLSQRDSNLVDGVRATKLAYGW
jgi:hypothetical protein